ncbi:hypothetical protein [Pontibacter beigongshangensis]|uniref:hypothetical protein n=1 Tax=Pontibacter beigongshangensis TaxID=2574733 RepID=UPI00165042DF|nr:hypothetical protein [Pontibacter beigongshangensis]
MKMLSGGAALCWCYSTPDCLLKIVHRRATITASEQKKADNHQHDQYQTTHSAAATAASATASSAATAKEPGQQEKFH